jgi:hypothetical protein
MAKDLVAGICRSVTERGAHSLNGAPGERVLFPWSSNGGFWSLIAGEVTSACRKRRARAPYDGWGSDESAALNG